MNLPNFIVLGAQKCGTTWMHEIFEQHPEIYVPEKKELEFFSYRGKPKRLGLEGYAEDFAGVKKETAIGEKTPSYLWNSNAYSEWNNKPKGFQPNIPGTINKFLGSDLKFIVCFRNPVQRAISGYLHNIRWEKIERTDSILDVGHLHGIVHMGFYYEHLRKWFEVFDREQFLVLQFEKIMRDKESHCHELFSFLEVNPDFEPASIKKKVHQGLQRKRVDGDIYLPKENHKFKGKEFNPDNYDLVIRAEEIEALRAIYHDDICRLEGLLNWNLSNWLKAS